MIAHAYALFLRLRIAYYTRALRDKLNGGQA